MDEWDKEEREDDLTEEKRNEELELYCTEYKPRDEDSVVEVMRTRVHFAIMDQIEHMIYAADIGNPNEIKKLILRDVQLYIEEYRPSESNSEEGNEDSLK
jgi:hypothetical protein